MLKLLVQYFFVLSCTSQWIGIERKDEKKERKKERESRKDEKSERNKVTVI